MRQKDGEAQVGGMSRAVMLVLRFRALALILFLVITGALCLQLRNIRATSDPVTPLIPPRHPFATTLQTIEAMNTLPETLMVIVEVQSGDIYNKETAEKIERIAGKLVGMQEIKPGGIRSLAVGLNHYENTAEGFMGEPILGRIPPETEEDFQAVKRRVAVNSLGIGTSVAYDGTATLITAPLVDLDTKLETTYKQFFVKEQTGLSLEEHKKKSLDAFHQKLLVLARDLKAKEEDGNHKLHFVGTRTLAAEMTEMARRQIPLALAAMLVLVVLLLVAYFRSLRGALLPVLALALSVLWALGMLGAGGMAWNPMGFLFPVMLGVLSLVCIAEVMNEVDRSSEEAAGKTQVIAVAYRRTPVVASVLAAGVVSTTLLVAGVPMLRELGAFGLFWAVGTFVVVALICPVLISLFPGPAKAKGEGLFEKVAEGMSGAFRGSKRVGLWALLVAVLVAGGLCAWKLDVGNNTPGSSYIRSTHPWNQGFRLFTERFNGLYSLLVHVKAKEEEGLLHPEAIREMGDFSTYLRGEGGARESVAFDWVLKLGRIALMDGNPKWWTVPASREDVEGLARLLTFPGGLEVMVDKSFSQATIASLFPEDDTESIDEYVSGMEGYIDSHPSEHLEFNLAGGLLGVTKAINDGTLQACAKTLALAFIAVFVVGISVTRSAFSSLIVTLSLVAAQAVAWLIMTALGGTISLATVPAAVVGVGFGAVLGMYLVRQVEPQGDGSNDVVEPLGAGWGRAGGAVLFFGALTFGAMLPWFFVDLRVLSDMALMLGITVVLESITAVVFIPSLAGRSTPQAD
jgi:predicted RND superfamily exporter protein